MNHLLATSFLLWVAIPAEHLTAGDSSSSGWTYPETQTVEQVDEFFGVRVADPFRWLEQDVRNSEEVAKWVEKQNELTFGYLESLAYREDIRRRLTRLWDYPSYGVPFPAGDRYLMFYNSGLQNQDVLYRLDGLESEPQVLIDPNTWSADGTVALAGAEPSPDGRYLAYGVAEAGSDWRVWRVIEVATGRVLDDRLDWIKFSGLAWTADSQGFYYGRYRQPEAGEEFQSLNLGMQVFYHRVGSEQSADRLIHEDPEHPQWGYRLDTTEDGRYLVVTVWKGTDAKYRILYRDLQAAEGPLVELVGEFSNEYAFIGNQDAWLYFRSDRQAPNRCVLRINVDAEEPQWETIIPEAEDVLEEVTWVGGKLIAQYLHDAKSAVRIFDLQGRPEGQVDLPGLGTVTGFDGRQNDRQTFFSFVSFNRPATIYRYELTSGQRSVFRETKVDLDPETVEVKQVFFPSKDGTRVPMFVVHRKDITLGGDHPTLLYGYGGFNIALTPSFSVTRMLWVQMGGVLAVANLRGGGEYGEKWHQGGTKLNKQNVFDDFVAAAQWLIDQNYTRPERLAIQGGSNGGLLVGAAMTQRPDLFAACLPAVGVMDMLRFHKFTAGRFWVDDYGCAEDSEEEFRALYAYSPYHALRPGVHYPATLITTADTDDRVIPAHSFKFAARLQRAQGGPAPVLIRIETRAGHGAGKPTAKRIEEAADQLAFLVDQLGMEYLTEDEAPAEVAPTARQRSSGGHHPDGGATPGRRGE
jgi:prolyl oligopeptidase